MSGIIGAGSKSGVIGAYPSGNIVQSVQSNVDAGASGVTYISSQSNVGITSKAITLKSSANKVLVMATYGLYMDGNGESKAISKIRRTPTGGSAVDVQVRFHFRDATTVKQPSSSMIFIDTPAPSGTLEVTYTLAVDGDTGNGNVGHRGSTAGPSVNLTLLEIQA